MMFMGLFWLVVVLLLLRWVYPSPGGRALPESTRAVEAEVARLRDEVDRLSGQVHRLLDEQAFLLRLLEQSRDLPRLPEPGSDAEPPEPPPHPPA